MPVQRGSSFESSALRCQLHRARMLTPSLPARFARAPMPLASPTRIRRGAPVTAMGAIPGRQAVLATRNTRVPASHVRVVVRQVGPGRLNAPRMIRKPAALVRAQLKSKGRRFKAEDIEVKGHMGEGSFGQVYMGILTMRGEDQRVVLKRVKNRVEGAEEMGQMEHLLNVYASRSAYGAVANFMGYCNVREDQVTAKLTRGVWLVWEYEGSRTLSYYLRRRDCVQAMASDLEVPTDAAVAAVMRQLLQDLMALHAAGLVHRDVKPLNIIFSEKDRRFKLIDLGACADLRTGTNYIPDQSILDPNFCPPEQEIDGMQFVLPTDGPHLAKELFALAISPVLWARHRPDRFDTWSAGLIFMQMALPSLRNDRALRTFNDAYKKAGFDLDVWRSRARVNSRDTWILDAEQGAGWSLAQGLLRPRSIQVDANGTVNFTNQGLAPRLGAAEALRHNFFKQAIRPYTSLDESDDEVETESGYATARPVAVKAEPNLWNFLTDKLFNLEAKLSEQASAATRSSTAVQKLEKEVASGKGSVRGLRAEKQNLQRIQSKISDTENEMEKTATSFWDFFTGKRSPSVRRSTGGRSPSTSVKAPSVRQSGKGKEAGSTKVSSANIEGALKDGVRRHNEVSGMLWRTFSSQINLLEKKIRNQQSATERQTAAVAKLKAAGLKSSLDEQRMLEEQRRLTKMEKRLSFLQENYNALKGQASGVMDILGVGKGGSAGVQAPASPPAGPKQAVPNTKPGSRWWALVTGKPAQARGSRGVEARDRAAPAPGGATPPRGSTVVRAPSWWPFAVRGQRKGSTREAASKEAVTETPTEVPVRYGQGDPLARSASSFVSAGFRLGGVAVQIAGEVANSIRNESARVLKDIEDDRERRRLKSLATKQFMGLLRQKKVTTADLYTTVKEKLSSEPRFTAIESDVERQELFDQYVQSAAKMERQAKARAAGDLKVLFGRLNVIPEQTSWSDVKGLLEAEAAYKALKSEEACRKLFEEYVQEKRLDRAARAAEDKADDAFRQMLLEVPKPPITPSSNWQLIKNQLWDDVRYQTLPEKRRRQLFGELIGELKMKDQSQKVRSAARAAIVPPTGRAMEAAGVSASAPADEDVSLEDATTLAEQQVQLQREYARMAAKLKAMERRMKIVQAKAAATKTEAVPASAPAQAGTLDNGTQEPKPAALKHEQ